MSRITLRQLEYLRAIAATGSLSAAADQEHVSRSTIAGALDELERGLGTRLCIRHKSLGIELTETGRMVLDAAHTVLGQVEDLEAVALADRLHGVLAVGCFGSLAPTVLARLTQIFTQQHPDVRIVHTVDSTDVLVDGLQAGRLDLIISYKLHADPALATIPLYETRMHVVLPADHRLAAQRTVDAHELEPEPMVLMTTPPSEEDVAEYYAGLGIQPDIRYRVSHFELGRSLVAAGLGYGLYIQRPRHDLTYEGVPLAVRPLSPSPRFERVSVAWLRERVPSAKARAFAELASQWGDRLAPRSLYLDDAPDPRSDSPGAPESIR